MPALELIGTIADVAGDRLACGPDGTWAVAGDRVVRLSDGREATAPRRLTGGLRLTAGALLAGTERLDLATGAWDDLPDPRPAVAEGIGELQVTAAAWDAAGARLAIAAALRPGRGAHAGSAGQHAWLTLLDGRARTAVAPLWAARGLPPRVVALEGGVVAADPDRRLRVWEGGVGQALGEDPVDDLALGDGGRLVVASHRDGTVVGRRLGAGDAADVLGEGAAGAVAAAADAPVAAWLTADGATVATGGATAVLAVPAPRALALDPAGTRLAVLGGDGALRLAALT